MKKDPYKYQIEYRKKTYITKSICVKKDDYEILQKNLKEKNINFRKLILDFLKEQGLLD